MAKIATKATALWVSLSIIGTGSAAWAAPGSKVVKPLPPVLAPPPVELPTAAPIELAPIVKEGTPGDLLMEDPVIPSLEGKFTPSNGSGTLQKGLTNQLAVPVISSAVPGNLVQIQGLGKSSEETDVQAFGISLSPAQGGGFDLASFPQFLWSSYEFQAGPALGTFNPRATAGSLTLQPWTVQALHGGASSVRAIGLGSSANLFQVSAGATDGHTMAAVVGTSAGSAQGPSGGFSGRWQVSPDEVLSFHLLVTDLDAKTPGPGNSMPNSRMRTTRAIPLLQLDTKVGLDAILKASVFYDDQTLRFEDPTLPSVLNTRDRIMQIGTSNAMLWEDWTFGVGLKNAQYKTAFENRNETVFDVMASKLIEPSSGFLVEPTVRAVVVSGYDIAPEASFGGRYTVNNNTGLFARVGLARRFPSMLSRYYSYPGAGTVRGTAANRDLKPETNWTGTLGTDWKLRKTFVSLQAYAQLVADAQVLTTFNATDDWIANQGNGQIVSLMARVQHPLNPWVDLNFNGTLTGSRLTSLSIAYPGQPRQLAVLSVGVHTAAELKGGGHEWEGLLYGRLASDAVGNSSGTRTPAYHEEDIEVRARFEGGSWLATARLEDLADQRPVLVLGYPSYGRTLSVLVSRQL